MSKHHVLITGALHEKVLNLFQQHSGLDVTYAPDIKRSVLLEKVKTAHVLVTRSETDVDRAVIDAAPHLKVVCRAAVGVGNIDISYATEKGILVVNCPGKNTNSAAELTLGLLLCMFRHIPEATHHLKAGGWDRHEFLGHELRGKRIGLVGLGNVGHRVARFAHGFEMEVLAYDPYLASEVFVRHKVTPKASLEELAREVDILSVHVPLNSETRGMINLDIMRQMHEGFYIVNAARGGVVVEDDILTMLHEGHCAGYAVDTFENEPTPRRDLVEHKNVYCTQHIGATTEEAQIAVGEAAYEQVVKALEGGVVDYPVNLPNVTVYDDPLLRSYSVLAEKLGSLAAQILAFNPNEIHLLYRGGLAGLDPALIRLGFIKGYCGQIFDEFISFVNAEAHFNKLGVKLIENLDSEFIGYKSALKILIFGDKGEKVSVGGVVFDEQYPRISLINEFYFEFDPNGYLIVMENNDRPGVIGDVGHFLGQQNINIDHFALSRNKRGGKAMAVIRTDTPLTPSQLNEFRRLNNILTAYAVSL